MHNPVRETSEERLGIDLMFDLNGDSRVDNAWLALAGAEDIGATGGSPFLAADSNLDGSVDCQTLTSGMA